MIYLILLAGFVKPGMNLNIPDYFNYSRQEVRVNHPFDVQAVKEPKAVRNDFLVNDDTTGYLGENSFYTTVDSAGNAYIVWQDLRNGSPDVWLIKKDASNNTVAGPVYVPEHYFEGDRPCGIATDGRTKIGVIYHYYNNKYYVRFFDLNLNPITGAISISDTNRRMSDVSISMNSSGKTLISWYDDRVASYDYAYGQIFDASNAKVDTNVRLDNATNDIWSSNAVISDNGDIFVAWECYTNATTGYDIYYRLLDSTYAEIATGKCNDDAGYVEQHKPYVSVNDNGYYVVIWQDYRNGPQNLYGQIYDSSGNTVGSNMQISNTVYYDYDVSMANDSIFTAVWEDTSAGPSDHDIYMRRFDKSGSSLTGATKINSDIGYKQSNPHIATAYDGSYFVEWEDYREGLEFAYAQRFTSGGSSVGGNFVIDKNKGEREQFFPVSVYNSKGKSIIFWADERDEPDTNIQGYSRNYMQVYDETGSPVGGNQDLTNQNYILPLEPSAANNDSIIVYVWENYNDSTRTDDVYFQRMDFSGTFFGSNVQVNKSPISSGFSFPDVGMDSTGAFTIAWLDDNSNIKMQRYLASGIGTGDTIVLNETSGSAIFPSCAITPAGNGLVVWSDNRGSSNQIYGQLINPDGSLLGNNFQIGSSSYAQYFPIVGASNTGFVASWQENKGDGWRIYAQRFGTDGSPLGSVITVTDDSIPWYAIMYNFDWEVLGFSLGYDYSMAVSPSGNFVFEWANTSADGDLDLYARGYNPDGTPMGGTFVVAEDVHPYDLQGLLQKRSVSANDTEILFTWSDTRRQKSYDVYGEVNTWAYAGISNRKKIATESPVSVYPNPYTTRFSVRFNLNKQGKVDISVYDIAGKLVKKSVKTYISGLHTVNMDISKIPQGVYFVRVNTGNIVSTQKIIHIR